MTTRHQDQVFDLDTAIQSAESSVKNLKSDVANAQSLIQRAQNRIEQLEMINQDNKQAMEDLAAQKKSLLRKYEMVDVEIKLLKQKQTPSTSPYWDN